MLPVCIPTYRRYDRLNRLLETLREGSVQPSRVVIMDNGGKLKGKWDPWNKDSIRAAFESSEPVLIFNPGTNLGVSRSWNWFFNNVPSELGSLIISNDDVEYESDTIDVLSRHMASPFNDLLLNGGFSLFAMKLSLFAEIGEFDEEFSPAYFEDNDYHWRIKLAGKDLTYCPDLKYHHHNSSTLESFTAEETAAHHKRFQKNRLYYICKWGGPPTRELFKTAFNK